MMDEATATRSLGDSPGAPDPALGSFPVVAREHYVIGDELARGGGGRLLRARDRRLDRVVAIKEPLAVSSQIERRFFREAVLTARLQHPSIVPVHEIGRWPSGEPFYAMKLVSGRSLKDVIAETATLADRLALLPTVLAVTDAIAYAHGEGVIHRDLKPSNVMVGAFGETQVIDWGLARDLRDGNAPDDEGIRGTPGTMAPEQARGERVDERADIYALGALLYHVLAGEPPYRAPTAAAIIAAVLAGPPAPLAPRAPNAPVELIAIAERAMARDPAARFPTAAEMAAELHRFQTGQLVASYRYTPWQLAQRWVRRRRGAVAVGALALVAITVVGGLSLRQVLDARARADARANDLVVANARLTIDRNPSAAVALLASLPAARLDAETRVIAADAAIRGLAHVLRFNGRLRALRFSPDGAHLIAAGDDGRIHLWDLATWTDQPFAASDRAILDAAVTGDSAIIAIDAAGVVRRWSIGNAPPTVVATGPANLHAAALSSDAHWVALFPVGAAAEIRELATGVRHVLHRTYASGMWSDDGSALALVEDSPDRAIGVLAMATGKVMPIGHSTGVVALTGVPEHGGRIAWVANDVLFQKTERMPSELVQESPAVALRYLPSGELVSSAGEIAGIADMRTRNQVGDYSVTVQRASEVIYQLEGEPIGSELLAVSPSGHAIASAGNDGAIWVWMLPDLRRSPSDTTLGAIVAVRGDRGDFIYGTAGPTFAHVDVKSGDARVIKCCDGAPAPPAVSRPFPVVADWNTGDFDPTPAPRAMLASRDGARAAALDSAGNVWALDLATERARFVAPRVAEIALAGDGLTIATRDADHNVHLWPFAGGDGRVVIAGAPVTAIAISGDGTVIAAACGDGTIRAVARGEPRTLVSGNHAPLTVVAISADGTTIAAGGERGVIELWNGARTHRALVGHDGELTLLAFSPDGNALASTGTDKRLRLWSIATGVPTLFVDRVGRLVSLRFRRDGLGLVTVGADWMVRVWDVPSLRSRVIRDGGNANPELFAAYTPDDQRIVSFDSIGVVFDVADDLPRDPEALHRWLVAATNVPAPL